MKAIFFRRDSFDTLSLLPAPYFTTCGYESLRLYYSIHRFQESWISLIIHLKKKKNSLNNFSTFKCWPTFAFILFSSHSSFYKIIVRLPAPFSFYIYNFYSMYGCCFSLHCFWYFCQHKLRYSLSQVLFFSLVISYKIFVFLIFLNSQIAFFF